MEDEKKKKNTTPRIVFIRVTICISKYHHHYIDLLLLFVYGMKMENAGPIQGIASREYVRYRTYRLMN